MNAVTFLSQIPTSSPVIWLPNASVDPHTKQYGLVFDKRVIDRNTFMSYPYGYRRLSQEDVEMAEMLCNL